MRKTLSASARPSTHARALAGRQATTRDRRWRRAHFARLGIAARTFEALVDDFTRTYCYTELDASLLEEAGRVRTKSGVCILFIGR
jgi:hypothetical protein